MLLSMNLPQPSLWHYSIKRLRDAVKQLLKNNGITKSRSLNTNAENAKKTKNSVDEKEVCLFDKLARTCWDEQAEMKLLHSMNKLRVEFIHDSLTGIKMHDETRQKGKKPLEGYHILDAGCGAGILSEALAKLGAKVTGVDVSKQMIDVACAHIKQNPGIEKEVVYKHETVEDHAKENLCCYDAVVASEVLEHITEKEIFLEACLLCLKVSGSIFLTTISKTIAAWIFYIFPTEYFFRVLPRGTHTLDKCITPQELGGLLEKYGCSVEEVRGMSYNFLRNEWHWRRNTRVNYVLLGKKRKEVLTHP